MNRIILLALGLSVAGCAHIEYTNGTDAKTIEPYTLSYGLGASVNVPGGTDMRMALVDGKQAYCTIRPVTQVFGDSARGACFFDTKQSGYFDKFYMLGTASMAITPDVHIAYVLLGANNQPVHAVNPVDSDALKAALAKRDEGLRQLAPAEVAIIARGEAADRQQHANADKQQANQDAYAACQERAQPSAASIILQGWLVSLINSAASSDACNEFYRSIPQ
jgi:hypothetical protein